MTTVPDGSLESFVLVGSAALILQAYPETWGHFNHRHNADFHLNPLDGKVPCRAAGWERDSCFAVAGGKKQPEATHSLRS